MFGVGQTFTIENIEFRFPIGKTVAIWKDGEFWEFGKAYSDGLLTKEDLEKINLIVRLLFPECYKLQNTENLY